MFNLKMEIISRLKGTLLGRYLRKRRWNAALLSEANIRKEIDDHMSRQISSEEKAEVFADIVDMAKKYRFSASEYFCYHFREKSEAERKSFISDLNRIDFCERLNKAKNLAIFDDKIKSAEIFSKYYGRDVCLIRGMNDLDRLLTFVGKHRRFMIKPISGTCGKGISIVELESKKSVVADFITELCAKKSNGYIAEELITAVPELAQFHPASLNTLRLATVQFDEGVEVIAAFFRTGRGGNIVDNAGAGGVFGTIDVQTGVIDAVGDEYGNNYTVHPDTKLQMVGFAIPHWREAMQMAKELALIVKGNRYTGWDLALTDKGWVMIEGNARGQFVWQMPRQKGYMAEANQILKRLHMKEMKNLSI